jgi:hypothetical protein
MTDQTIIINPVRNSNCTVQPSQINGGSLAQSFNLQSMRIIKGYASLIPYPGYGQSMFLNSSNDEPISLGCGDCIISASIQSNKIVADSSVSIMIWSCQAPLGYNSLINEWIPPLTIGSGISVTNDIITVAQLNTGLNIKVDGVNYPYSYCNYLLGIINYANLITSSNPRVNLTLLILNPIVTS